MKLYEILLRKIGLMGDRPDNFQRLPVKEDKIYNPIGCKIGGVVKVDSLDLRDHRFLVKEILEYSIKVGSSIHKMVDYVLLSRPIDKPDFTIRLRVVPNSDSKSQITHRVMAMSLYDDLSYNEGLHDVVRDVTLKFVVDDDKDDTDASNDTHEEFWRVNDVKSSYISSVKSLVDNNGDGKVAAEEIAKSQIEFWDYSRMTEMDGVETEEFLFVEMNKDSGWFQIWRGAELIPERVEVF